jgi:hypothetical protein
MNGLRIGLGAAIMILAWQSLRRNTRSLFFVVSGLAVFVHYSAVLVFGLLWLFEVNWQSRRGGFWLGIAGILLLSTIVVVLRQDYFTAKLELYMDYSSPSLLSGASKFIIAVVLFGGFIFSEIRRSIKFRVITAFLLSILLAQIIAYYSFAGLRIADLLLFTLPLVQIRSHDHCNCQISNRYQNALIFSGFIGVLFVYRNFLDDFGGKLTGSNSPFLPYRIIEDL